MLAVSMFGGGDHDVDADHDVDLDHDADMDHDAQHGDVAGFATMFLSLRFWTFFSAFFGLTGLVMDGLELLPGALLPLGAALGMGGLVASSAHTLIKRLTAAEVGRVPTAADYVGKSARVLIGFDSDNPGKVRLELAGKDVDVLAVTDDEARLENGDSVLIIEMQGATASVARMKE